MNKGGPLFADFFILFRHFQLQAEDSEGDITSKTYVARADVLLYSSSHETKRKLFHERTSIFYTPPLIRSNKFDGFSNAGRGAFLGGKHVRKRKTGSGKSRARNSTIVNTLSSRQRNFSQ